MGGSTTTTVDNNNPYSNALATSAGATWKMLEPMIVANLQGRQTPMGETTQGATEQIMRHYAGRYGQPTGTETFNQGLEKGWEDLTKPNMDWMKVAGGLYGAGQQGPGGTTTTANQNLGPLDYAQIAATLAALI